MLVPNCQNAHVPKGKLDEYLLSETHSVGKAKAKFFHQAGFTKENSELLRDELLKLLKRHDYQQAISTGFGIKYVVEGRLNTPFQSQIRLRTIWIIEDGKDIPSFVTAYPIKMRGKND